MTSTSRNDLFLRWVLIGSALVLAPTGSQAADASATPGSHQRVVENPICRWSTLQCQSSGVNSLAEDCSSQGEAATAAAHERGAAGDVFGKCCLDPEAEPFYTPIIQERAWTSPIWVVPAS